MVTNNFGVELMLDTTSTHDIKGASGLPIDDVGEVSVLPPSVIAVWHFQPTSNIRPYIGAGLNYTFFFSEDQTITSLKVSVDDPPSSGTAAPGKISIAGTEYDFPENQGGALTGAYTATILLNAPIVVAAGGTGHEVKFIQNEVSLCNDAYFTDEQCPFLFISEVQFFGPVAGAGATRVSFVLRYILCLG